MVSNDVVLWNLVGAGEHELLKLIYEQEMRDVDRRRMQAACLRCAPRRTPPRYSKSSRVNRCGDSAEAYRGLRYDDVYL